MKPPYGNPAAIDRLQRAAGPVAIAVTFAVMSAWSWGTWSDVLVDFGRELYLAWRITEGDVLYRDLASYYGPLSPYLNALWFFIGGASVRTLWLANLVLLALLAGLSYRLLCTLGDRFSATLAVLLFLVVCAFLVGNYNFVAPYSHELAHGVLLGIAAFAALARWQASGRSAWLALAGACTGLVLLTKPEAALATFAGVAVAVAATPGRHASGRAFRLTAAATLIPPVVAVASLSCAMPPAEALAALVAPWRAVATAAATDMPFYERMMGIEAPWSNAVLMLAWAGAGWLALLPALALSERWRGRQRGVHGAALALFALYVALLLAWGRSVPWLEPARALPVLAAGALVVALQQRRRSDAARWALAAGFSVMALGLLGKMVLHAGLHRYGFALAAPALMLAITAMASWLPAHLAARGAQVLFVRAAVAALALGLAAGHVDRGAQLLAGKTWEVGDGADAFRADSRARDVIPALAELQALPPEATVVAFPEGVALNYLARRRNPTRYLLFQPFELGLFDERAMRDALERSPPDRVVLVHKDTGEFGAQWFGRDYGVELMDWVRTNYVPQAPLGDPPLQDGSRFGLQIWSRRDD